MIDRNAQTAAVLDEMVAGIMGVKANKAAQLTPVVTETAKIPADLPGVLMATEGLADVAKDLRRQAQVLLDVADGLDVILGKPSAVEAHHKDQAETERKLVEREADRRAAEGQSPADIEAFRADFEAKKAAAQAAVFQSSDAEADDGGDGWTCRTHGDEDIRNLTSAKGRKYRACGVPNCKEFERA